MNAAAEDRLAEIMDAATRALAPPIETILAEGERLGRRRRRRRHAAIATGTAVVVLAGGVGVAAAVHLSRPTHSNDVAAAVTHTPSQAPASGGTPSPSAAFPAAPVVTPNPNQPRAPITDQAAARILQLSGGSNWVFGFYDQKVATPGSLLDGQIMYGKGLMARVVIRIGNTTKSGMDPADCAEQKPALAGADKRPTGAPPPSCNVVVYPNGDMVMQVVTTANAFEVYQYRIIAYRVDGIALSITVGNGDWDYKHSPNLTAAPPLTIAQWTSIALDRSWQFRVPAWLDQFPTPTSSP